MHLKFSKGGPQWLGSGLRPSLRENKIEQIQSALFYCYILLQTREQPVRT